MGKLLRVLIVEDSEDDKELMLRELRRGGYEPEALRIESADQMTAALDRQEWDLVLSDYSIPGFGGLAALAIHRARGLDVPFIIVSGTIGEEIAIEALKSGANDYLLKERLVRLAPAVDRELRDAAERAEKARVKELLRQTEEQLLHSQKMEALGRLAGGISHDINNILAIIGLHCESALERLGQPNLVRKAIEQIHSSQRRAARLTQQLLLFSRRQPMELGPVKVNEVIQGMNEMARRLIGEDIVLDLDLRADGGIIRSDSGLIGQILMNLIVNAKDAMPRGGRIGIRTCRVMLESGDIPSQPKAEGAFVEILVEDTGSGMPPEVLSRIFEPFFTTKGVGKGTGLGLSTAFGIVQQHKGSLTVTSEVGKGSSFRILLPECASASGPEIRPERKSNSLEGTEAVLLVEDEEELREVVAETLRNHGYEVIEARHGLDALEILNRSRLIPDLVVTDVVMPGLDGLRMLERIRSSHNAVKVLYLSGYTEETLSQYSVSGTQADFLEKPFSSGDLLRKIRTILD